MALFLSNEGHYDLQQYFLKWAPGIPPLHIRRRLLGLVDTNSDSVTDNYSDADDWSLVVSMAGITLDSESDASEDANTSYTDDNDAAASPLGSEVGETTSGMLFWGRSQELWLPGGHSIWEWSSADEMSAAAHALISTVNNVAQGERYFPEHAIQLIGGYQPKAPGTIPDPVVASIDDALRCIQDVRSYKEVGPAIDAVSTWAATASTTELEDFNKSCEIFPYAMWVRVSSSGAE